MNYLTLSKEPLQQYSVALLVPVIRKDEILKAYITPYNLDPENVVVFDLHYSQTKKKTPAAEIKQYLEEMLIPHLIDAGVKYLIVTDSEYFKVLTKAAKVDANIGYVMDSCLGDFKVIYAPNYRQIFFDPEKITTKISQAINALTKHMVGEYVSPGSNIFHHEEYLYTVDEIASALERLIQENRPLSADIEAFSLKHYSAGIGTVSFSWSKYEGIAFPVDLHPEAIYIRKLLKRFFERFQPKMRWHHISYDVTVLIYQLFMADLLDTKGLLNGLDIMLRNWDDTKLISYLATNSCAGNELSLKAQAQEFAGNYAQENIKDIRKIPLPDLLKYNLADTLSTNYVYDKHWPTLIADQQLDIYENIFKPAIVDIIQMQLTGMPLDMNRVLEVKQLLETDQNIALAKLANNPQIQRFEYQLNEDWVAKRNASMKVKRIAIGDEPQTFNPNSDQQLQKLLFEMLALPVISKTDNKQPSTDGDTLKALLNHTTDPVILEMLGALGDLSTVSVILTSFIPAMLEAPQGPDGWHYLFGNFNLGGTLGGRLSSSGPNLQNIPSGAEGEKTNKGRYGKWIKSCFKAPPGWLFSGLDFASLEDRISALTTKDPNKLKVYTDGYDGHCLRAYAYFTEQMPDIDPTSVDSINSIEKKYKPLRQKSKNPTFALTYDGTYVTLMTNYGFSEEFAKKIVASYKELYQVSIDWVQAKLDRASIDGYVTVAFGLRVRTPLLKQVIRGNSKTPYEAMAEGRSAGNALGQSWCMLNTRAASEFMGKVRKSEYSLDIRPCAQIHDASYYLIREDLAVIKYCNDHLVDAVKWQDHPDIVHDDVKLGGEFGIFYPTWNEEATIPNDSTIEQIIEVIDKHVAKLSEKQ